MMGVVGSGMLGILSVLHGFMSRDGQMMLLVSGSVIVSSICLG